MPLKSNIPEPNQDGKHQDWKLVNCPECGNECWESDKSREVQKTGVVALCTHCALKKGMEGCNTNGKSNHGAAKAQNREDH
jgi:hypothetical protein